MTSILKVDTIQDADGNNIINESGNTITIGASGDTTNIIGTLQNDGAAVGGTNTPNFHAYVSGNQSIANSTFQTVIFNVEYFDSASAYNVSDGKFTVPSGQAGKYLFTFNLRAGAWEAPRFITVFSKNGSDVSYFEHAAADSNERVSKGGSIIMDLAVSDYITIKLYQTSGSAQNITGTTNQSSNFFTGMKLVE
jgi:hypothetical protein